MANHLRELVECCENKSFQFVFDLTEEKLDALGSLTLRLARRAVCFDAGDVSNVDGFKVIDELIHLPYECTWVEFVREAPGGNILIGMMANEHDGEITTQLWVKTFGEWRYEFTFNTSATKCPSRVIHLADPNGGRKKAAQQTMFMFRAFLSAINCTNVRRIEHKHDAKLQKARARRGKQPLFSYWTLELTPGRVDDGQDLGRTHASPRLHLRRGHPRQYAPGKYTLVQPCAVGNTAAGMIHKDYALRQRPVPDAAAVNAQK